MTARIMIIDDEAPIRDMVRFALELSHFEVIEAETAKEGQRKIIEKTPDLLLLDWMLPDQAGIELAQTLKVQYPALPIIMLTARAEEESRVLGLEQADDYVIKPFSPRELIARIKAVLRRSQTNAGENTEPAQFISLGSLCVNQDSQQVFINDQAVKTGPIEYKLICFLLLTPIKSLAVSNFLIAFGGLRSMLANALSMCIFVALEKFSNLLAAIIIFIPHVAQVTACAYLLRMILHEYWTAL